MMQPPSLTRRTLGTAGIAWIAASGIAAAQHAAGGAQEQQSARGLPADATTQHTLVLPDRQLRITATAGAVQPTMDKPAPVADVAFIAFVLEGADRTSRPVTFVFNGGPGFASGWLDVGAVGPWRIPMNGSAVAPAAPAEPAPNADTWLDFTDLVFIDPPGTGYSRIRATDDETRRGIWSVDGDIKCLAETIRRWIDRFGRAVSPKYILGESYGGFRAPRLARELASNQGTGINGLLLVSPALEIPARGGAFDPFHYVTRLPSMTAAARARHGPVTKAQLADVEHYATGEYLADILAGERDPAAIERRSSQVAAFTGLDPVLVRRYHGLIDMQVFLHALDAGQSQVGSAYDATVTDPDPFPLETLSEPPDPVLEGLKAPISSAMVSIYHDRLQWRPDTPYRLFGQQAAHQWQWPRGTRAQSVSFLRTALALDANLRVFVAHGLFDLVTPYLATQLMLAQIPRGAGAGRVRMEVYPGGHMFYTDDQSRAAWRSAAQDLYRAGAQALPAR